MATTSGSRRQNPTRGGRTQQVFSALLERIRSGQLRPGMRIREDEMAEVLGVSRTPVREAIARLQVRGLVEAGPKGVAVVELDHARILEVYAMRAVLESAAARFAAEHATAGDLALLEHCFRTLEAAGDDPAAVAAANTLFHRAICDAAHNAYLLRMLGDLNDSLTLLPSTTFAVPGRISEARVEHRKLLRAILARDPDAAEQVARHHMARARDARLQLLFAGN